MEKNTITQSEINNIVWKACDTFRGVIDPAQYKDYILTFLFVKYLESGETYSRNIKPENKVELSWLKSIKNYSAKPKRSPASATATSEKSWWLTTKSKTKIKNWKKQEKKPTGQAWPRANSWPA